MSEAPETMWVFPKKDWFNAGASTHRITVAGAKDVQYRHADLPATDEQAFANEKVKALVEAMREIDFEYDPWEGGVNAKIMFKIARAALAAMEEKP